MWTIFVTIRVVGALNLLSVPDPPSISGPHLPLVSTRDNGDQTKVPVFPSLALLLVDDSDCKRQWP